MKWYNDMFKMTSRISLLLCGAVAFASAADSTLVEKQKNLVGTLDSLNSSSISWISAKIRPTPT